MFPECKRELPFDFIVAGTTGEFLGGAYRSRRASLLLKVETAQMEDTQATASAYLTAQTVVAAQHYSGVEPARLLNAEACVERFGCGWETFDFGSHTGARPPVGDGKSVMRCPARNCAGFVSSSTWTCSVCSTSVCDTCREPRRHGQPHRCDPGTVASVRAIAAEARPCPRCAALISKVDGCDQMFCTQCHTTYSWVTGKVIRGEVHNPHYFQWLFRVRNRGPVERLAGAAAADAGAPPCERFITFEGLRTCFDAKDVEEAHGLRARLPVVDDVWSQLPSAAHYYLALENMRQNIVHVRATSGNHADALAVVDNRDLRVQLQVAVIDEAKFRDLVVARDSEQRRLACYRDVYLTVYQIALAIFDNLYTFARERHRIRSTVVRHRPRAAFLFETYTQLQNGIHAANDCLAHLDATFGCDARLHRFPCHPYVAARPAPREEAALP